MQKLIRIDWTATAWLGVTCAALLAASGCGSPRRGEPVAGPLMTSAPDVQQGQRVFMEHCHMCHPGGEGGLGPSINDKPLPGFAIRTQIRHGLGVMPAFDVNSIPPEQLNSLVAYLKALRQQTPQRTAAPGPARNQR